MKDITLYPPVQGKKNLKQLIPILKSKVCVFLYSAISLLGFCPTEKQPDLRKNAQG